MPLTKCPRSGMLYNNDLTPVHPSVMTEEEADYEKAIEYLASHPGASIMQIAEQTGVEEDCIMRLVTQGRIENINREEAERRQKQQADEFKRQEKRRARIAKKMQSIQLPKKKKVEFGGTVRSALEQKRKVPF